MVTIHRFEDLEVWQVSREICQAIYSLTQTDKFKKDYALVDQIKRSSGSAMDNIAEGYERDGNKEFIQFLTISKASIGETRSQLYRALDFGYIQKEEFESMNEKCLRLSRQLQKFSDYLRKSPIKGRKFQT
ncbi:four helix bundle protein [Prolixibacter denitrificans]|uniref:Four helix bundle protein n=1 Tax=Prolixibacter denitrificans TaxID=1541063 RepID=A0A2P8CBY4_9BACT|nr:four helix bundle protein [Prolixibacter denitrificans]PSK82483.1 four helix bundle protein [Prolixibacter denitrificans]GET22773.1 four helix bundle protein [Prolixibacter denitrificans]